MTKAGIVTSRGRPQRVKRTLLNRIAGQKLSITSPKTTVRPLAYAPENSQGPTGQVVIYDLAAVLLH